MASVDSVRIGNWQEELALKRATGVARAPKAGPETHATSFKARLIEHSARVESRDWCSTMHAAHVASVATPVIVGQRTQLLDKEFREAVDEMMRRKNEKVVPASYYDTTYTSGFPRHPEVAYRH